MASLIVAGENYGSNFPKYLFVKINKILNLYNNLN